MPRSAIRSVAVDHVLRVREMPAVIAQLASEPAKGRRRMPRRKTKRAGVAEHGTHGLHEDRPRGPLSAFTCPDCGGALWNVRNGALARFRCHVGHALSVESLMAGQDDGVEEALWTAVRALEEKAELRRRMAHRARLGKLPLVFRRYMEHAEEGERQSQIIRALLTGDGEVASRAAVRAARSRRRRERPE